MGMKRRWTWTPCCLKTFSRASTSGQPSTDWRQSMKWLMKSGVMWSTWNPGSADREIRPVRLECVGRCVEWGQEGLSLPSFVSFTSYSRCVRRESRSWASSNVKTRPTFVPQVSSTLDLRNHQTHYGSGLSGFFQTLKSFNRRQEGVDLPWKWGKWFAIFWQNLNGFLHISPASPFRYRKTLKRNLQNTINPTS